jgi:hypothetical protein
LLRGEAREGAETARRLGEALHRQEADVAGLERLRGAFLDLLRERGYFVKTPEDVATSVREIRDVGPGFDLYDLSDALAACDVAASDCLGLSPRRCLPELSVWFGRPCSCGPRPRWKEKPNGA